MGKSIFRRRQGILRGVGYSSVLCEVVVGLADD